MNKVLYFIPLLLTGCLSTGGSNDSSTTSTHPGRQPPSNNQGSSSSSGNKNSLNTFIDTDKFEKNITNENNNNIKQALSDAKVSTTEKNMNIATEALKQNTADSTYISSKIAKLDSVIALYPTYQGKLDEFNNSNKNYLPLYYNGQYEARYITTEENPNPDYDDKKETDETNPEFIYTEKQESDSEFASRLLQIVGNTYADFNSLSAGEYIVKTLHKWAEEIQNILGKNDIVLDDTKIEEQFQFIYSELCTIKTQIDKDYYDIKNELLTKLKGIDPSVKEIPLSLENLITYYKLEQSILKAVESVDYIISSTPTSSNYTATSLYDDEETKTVKFIYDENSKSYTLLLSDIRIEEDTENSKANKGDKDDTEKEPIKTIREVKFNASDFVSTDNYYIASKSLNVSEPVIYKTYFNNLKDYINAGGNYDFEISKRKNEAINIIKRVIYNQYPTYDDINYFNEWFGTALSVDGFSQSDVSSYLSEAQLAISILNKTNAIFDISTINKITDTVKLGGPSLKLSYSDFGLWTIKESTEYTGDKDLISAKKDTEVENSYSYIDNPFFTGLDEFKAAFSPKEGAAINETTKFYGKTIASASKGDTRNDLVGKATMTIDNQDATGSVNLSFDKWYSFIFNNIDFSNSNGFALNDTVVSVEGRANDTDIKITATKDNVKGNIAGSLYGPDVNNPTEGVGAYNIIADDFKLDGAFGVKK
ncbi:hypothetical protein HDR59_00760 [bacterium]|nr:hypothetical protein [bacterium]